MRQVTGQKLFTTWAFNQGSACDNHKYSEDN